MLHLQYSVYKSKNVRIACTYNGRDGEVSLMHLLGEPLHLPTRVTEDNSLCDGECLVQITQCVQFPLLTVYL